jgi:hypothetical protein
MITIRTWLHRSPARFAIGRRCLTLSFRNKLTGKSILGEVPVVVCLTSYGTRLRFVYLAIESLSRGKDKPRRILLWVDDNEFFSRPPASIRRLIKRGLELKICSNYGSFKKFYPYVMDNLDDSLPLVTADDDVFYDIGWLGELYAAHVKDRSTIWAGRARVIKMEETTLRPYDEWPLATDTKPSHAKLATGVSGVIYPPAFLVRLREAGDGFLLKCPSADDLWLKAQAVRSRVKVGQVAATSREYVPLPFASRTALMITNVSEQGNDSQARQVFDEDDLRVIAKDIFPSV